MKRKEEEEEEKRRRQKRYGILKFVWNLYGISMVLGIEYYEFSMESLVQT